MVKYQNDQEFLGKNDAKEKGCKGVLSIGSQGNLESKYQKFGGKSKNLKKGEGCKELKILRHSKIQNI